MSTDDMIVLAVAASLIGMLALHLWLATRVLHLEWRGHAHQERLERLARDHHRCTQERACTRRRRR